MSWVVGELSIKEERDDWLGRTVKVARLVSRERKANLFPPLIEVQVLQIAADRVVLAGLEREDLARSDRAQTWVLHLQPQQRPENTAPVPLGRLAEPERGF